MATTDNKNVVPDGQQTTSTTQAVGSRRILSRIPKKKRALLAIVLVVLVLAVGWIVASRQLHVGQKVYAQAAGHKIYKQDIKNLIGGTKGISQHNAAIVLADKYLTEAMAKQQGVTVTNKDIETAYGSYIDQQKKSNPYAYQSQVNQLYFKELQNNNSGVYKGDLLVAQFSRYIPYQSGLLAEKQALNPQIGNPVAIAADKKYAQDFITNLYNQIKTSKITFDQAAQMERSDPNLGEQAYPTLSHSGSFDTSSSNITRNNLIEAPSIQQKVRDIKQGQLTKPFVVRVSNSDNGTSTAESYFLVVKMNSVSGHPTGLPFDQYLAQSKQKLGYKVYV